MSGREIKVPFEIYKQWCEICSDREKTLTPQEEIRAQYSELRKKPVRIICRALSRCRHHGRITE